MLNKNTIINVAKNYYFAQFDAIDHAEMALVIYANQSRDEVNYATRNEQSRLMN